MIRFIITIDMCEDPGRLRNTEDASQLLYAISDGQIDGDVKIETVSSFDFKRTCGYKYYGFCSDCFCCKKANECKLVTNMEK